MDVVSTVIGIFGWLGVIVGAIMFFVFGLPKIAKAKGKVNAGIGIAAVVVGLLLVAIFPVAIPTGGIGGAPNGGGAAGWQVCYKDVNGPTVGGGICPTSAAGILTIHAGQPGTFPTTPFAYWYANVTITPPAGSTQTSFNEIAALGSVPTVSNTSNPSTSGAVLATRVSGVYDVSITPASGSTSYAQATIPVVPGTAKTVAYQIHWSATLTELALGQYPTSFSISLTFVDQTSGASIGTLTMTVTVNHN